MRQPRLSTVVERRLLVNYRVDPGIAASLLPAPLRPQQVGGWAVAGICLIRLGQIRPAWVPHGPGLRSENVPVAVDTSGVLAGRALAQISGTCVLDTTGQAYCWGNDDNGELGNGRDATFSDVPMRVLGRHLFTWISDGGEDVCAIDTTARAWCWGNNDSGQLGNGHVSDDSVIPAAVDTGGILAGRPITRIAAGGSGACAVSHGHLYCWGYNADGQLGDGTTTSSDVPVAVAPRR